MSKIEKISIRNFKAISEQDIDFKGCTAIVIAGNNKGKTSLLRGMIDRIRFTRPDVMVKEGQSSGSGELVLTTGEKFTWEFDIEGKDKLQLVTADGKKKSVTKEIANQFFPPAFDIDRFLQSQPKEQKLQIQKIVGLDFTDIDARYDAAYADRTEKNREADKFHAKLTTILKVDKVDPVDLSELKAEKEREEAAMKVIYDANVEANNVLRRAWDAEKEKINSECTAHNAAQVENMANYNACYDALAVLVKHGFSKEEANRFREEKKNLILENKIATDLHPKEPEYVKEPADDTKLKEIDEKILKASEINSRADDYKKYIDHKAQTEAAQKDAREADDLVKSIENERQVLINSANFPKGVSVSSFGVTVDGLPLNKDQISTSKIYCAALQIAAMGLGEVKTLYFDASFLDKITLSEIEAWAYTQDLQLLIERPDFEGGEITYQLIEYTGN